MLSKHNERIFGTKFVIQLKKTTSMKSIRNIAFSALLAVGAFTMVTYTACTKDECKDVVCQNGGTCVTGTCNCPTGYEGTNCETITRDKFVGTYTGTENCTVGSDTYSITIDKNSDDLKMTYKNVYNQNYSAVCTVTNTTTFTFNETQNGATFTGTGTLNGNTLTVDYTITDALSSNTCKYIGVK